MSDEYKATEKMQRRRALCGILAIVLAGAAVKQYARIGPSAAEADVQENIPLVSDTPSINQTAVNRLSASQANRDLMDHIEMVLTTFKAPRLHPFIRWQTLKMNPFRRMTNDAPEENTAVARQRREKTNAITAAGQLMLRSILHGTAAPACLINNLLLREQQQINGFIVERIKTKSVIVRQGIYRFEISLVKND